MKRTLRILVEPLRRLGLAIGKFNTFLILSLSYFLVLFPIGDRKSTRLNSSHYS